MTLKGEARTRYIRDYTRRKREAERTARAGKKRIHREAEPQTTADVTRLQAENTALKAENETLKRAAAEAKVAPAKPHGKRRQSRHAVFEEMVVA